MPMFTDAELAAMREDSEAALPETSVEIVRKTKTADAKGGRTVAESTVATVAGRKSIASMSAVAEAGIGERLAGRTAWVVMLPYGTDVTERDAIQIDGEAFEVLAVQGSRSYEITLKLLCARIR